MSTLGIGIGTNVLPPVAGIPQARRDLSVAAAVSMGAGFVRLNPGLGDLAFAMGTGGTIPSGSSVWATFDRQFGLIAGSGLPCVVALDCPPSSSITGQVVSTSVADALVQFGAKSRFTYAADTAKVTALYLQVVARLLTFIPASRLYVIAANEATAPYQGGGTGATIGGTVVAYAQIQPDYLAALGTIAAAVKAAYPAVPLGSVCFADARSTAQGASLVPDFWPEPAALASPVPALFSLCDFHCCNVYASFSGLRSWISPDESAARYVAKLRAFRSGMFAKGGGWAAEVAKPLLVTETATNYGFLGLDQPVLRYGAERDVAAHTAARLAALEAEPGLLGVAHYQAVSEVVGTEDQRAVSAFSMVTPDLKVRRSFYAVGAMLRGWVPTAPPGSAGDLAEPAIVGV